VVTKGRVGGERFLLHGSLVIVNGTMLGGVPDSSEFDKIIRDAMKGRVSGRTQKTE
jgi:hypothetical protein